MTNDQAPMTKGQNFGELALVIGIWSLVIPQLRALRASVVNPTL
jgi:hypothetical protein